jgi:hypothetical protein
MYTAIYTCILTEELLIIVRGESRCMPGLLTMVRIRSRVGLRDMVRNRARAKLKDWLKLRVRVTVRIRVTVSVRVRNKGGYGTTVTQLNTT